MADDPPCHEALREELEARCREVAELRENAEHLRAILSSLEGTPVMLLDRDATVLSLFRSRGAEGYGLVEQQVVGRRIADFTPPEAARSTLARIRQVFETGESQHFEQTVELPAGRFTHDVHYSPVRDAAGRVRAVLSLSRDITDRVRAEEQVRRLAWYDSLTGLPNRRLFREKLDRALESARRHRTSLGLLFVDLDRFKRVNDTLGHSGGDELLREVAVRLVHSVRLSDAVGRPEKGRSVSRLGGDEFTVLLSEIADPRDASRVAERILHALAAPVSVDGRELFATASIGIAIHPQDGGDADTLLRHADAAMYQAKKQGRGQYRFLTRALNAAAARQLHLESRLRGAADRGELALRFQPLRCAASGRLVGGEALLRWSDPEFGPVPPPEFIPMAEELGLIVEIGAWVLDQACTQWARWRDAGLRPVRLAVNVSSYQLRHPAFVEAVSHALQQTGMSADQLDFELTESAIMQDDELTSHALRALSDLGVGLVLDDFGTGYSSLSYLRRFPIDGVKIDRSFVKEIASDPDSAALTAAIIAMAQRLQLRVVAEGVETLEQAQRLREQGCQVLQGYLLSQPLGAEAFTALLESEKS